MAKPKANRPAAKTTATISQLVAPSGALTVTTTTVQAITSNGYQLTMTIIPDQEGPTLRLELTNQPDTVQYHLRVNRANDRTDLVQKTLRKLADLWPACDFKFTANDRGEITDIV